MREASSLEALLDTTPATAPETPQGALDGAALQLDIQAFSGAANSRAQKMRRALKAALNAKAAGDLRACARHAMDALNINEDDPTANHVMAVALDQLGHVSRALNFYERAWRLAPNDPQIYLGMGLAAWKLDMMEVAEKFFRLSLQIAPDNIEARVNLSGVLRDTGRFGDAIELLREGIYQYAEEPQLWNALGTVLLHQGEPDQAETFYQEVLRLSPDFARGWHNLSYARTTAGDVPGALEASEQALQRVQADTRDAYEMRHAYAMGLLAAGRLEEGWRTLEIRRDARYGAMVFRNGGESVTPEGPQSLAGRRVLVVGEQGVGDEVLHFNALPDLDQEIGPDGALMIACEQRLIPLLQRTFPNAHIGPHGTISREARKIRGVSWAEGDKTPDVWTPAATLLARYRGALADFPTKAGFLTPDPARVAAFRSELASLGPGPKVGLCWKSKNMSATRQKYFSPFEDWRAVLKTPGVHFVSMQYGDVDSEIAQAAEEYGVRIHQLADLDVMNDLDGVAAAGAALDLTLGPMNASTNLAAAAGGQVWIIALSSHWPLLGTDRLPFYTGSRAFCPQKVGVWGPAMKEMAEALASFQPQKAAA